MAEGAKFGWKIQKIKEFGPRADYSALSEPLPCPPWGMAWKKDKLTHQWKLMFAPEEEKSKNETTRVIGDEKKLAKENECFYVEHYVLPTDTFQGLCLAYRISPVRLRQLNAFSGTSLKLAPSKLIIPIPDVRSVLDGTLRIQDIDDPNFKHQVLSLEFPILTSEEVRAYLIMCAWDLRTAIQTAKADLDWEQARSPSASKNNSVSTPPFELVAHVAVPVANSITNSTNYQFEIELSSSVHGKSQSSSFLLSRETCDAAKELSRPLLPRQ
uniref:LysM domain-containing protein n=1 Tax=Helicotheca tamesis TaxID=374047 RepID=A0A7S2HWY8_9STRA|mmetsp:Transcript_3569/g.4829  ORF Transcript_3569/g.4829 Transcript_3569/m.4829 type:complete len:270 (+) Transcript_3569:141-950(+)|eukprot:CAMPEP_0185723402 /NCGR_PEP_ID=MMETSP1171-20130828/258_1 /TAXON_ID=374046 /ORGANISM="Helicotheca tamensis, Strain CCMP826" /LENGTH=269 /DNA_ID=CAMNT_0028391101 /DNA_START=104 /DNA_END=913 /DNA_ORIENTATION=+